mgnify:CR=1 FL=1
MKISTKGRYGLRAFIDLACYGAEEPVSISSIISQAGDIGTISGTAHGEAEKAGLVKSIRGAGGGYRLAKDAAEVSVGDVLRALEGDLGTCDLCSTSFGRQLRDPGKLYHEICLEESQ